MFFFFFAINQISYGNIHNYSKREEKIAKRSRGDYDELEAFVEHLCECGFDGIDAKYKPHYLKGNYAKHCECHVKNNLLLIWREKSNPNVIVLVPTGTHSDLF